MSFIRSSPPSWVGALFSPSSATQNMKKTYFSKGSTRDKGNVDKLGKDKTLPCRITVGVAGRSQKQVLFGSSSGDAETWSFPTPKAPVVGGCMLARFPCKACIRSKKGQVLFNFSCKVRTPSSRSSSKRPPLLLFFSWTTSLCLFRYQLYLFMRLISGGKASNLQQNQHLPETVLLACTFPEIFVLFPML